MATPPARFRIVLTTVDSDERAERLARALVERRLAACVNILGPLRSVYRWKGEVLAEPERLLVIKTTVERHAELALAVKELHAYEVPELLALDVADGDPAYLAWLADCVATPPAD